MNHDALDRLLSQPEVQAVRALARVPTILVGGAVRDALLGRPAVHDLDFAVQGNALSLGRAVANAIKGDFYVLDATRGTARVLLPTRPDRPALIMDFAACRGPDWRSDALARDFTINTLAVSLEQGTLLDETGGLADLQAGVIRAVTPQAIEDDPVRALRAVRLACALDMRIAPDTADLVRAGSALLSRPSVERLRDELMAILALDNAARATQMLDSFGLLSPLLPEIEPLRTCPLARDPQTSILQHTWRVMAALDDLLDDMRVVLARGTMRCRTPRSSPSTLPGRLRMAGRVQRPVVWPRCCMTAASRLSARWTQKDTFTSLATSSPAQPGQDNGRAHCGSAMRRCCAPRRLSVTIRLCPAWPTSSIRRRRARYTASSTQPATARLN